MGLVSVAINEYEKFRILKNINKKYLTTVQNKKLIRQILFYIIKFFSLFFFKALFSSSLLLFSL